MKLWCIPDKRIVRQRAFHHPQTIRNRHSTPRRSRETRYNCPIPRRKECQRTKAAGNNSPTKEIYVPRRNGFA